MQVTIVLPPDSLTGRIRVFAAYANLLSARGHSVTVVQPRHARAGMRGTVKSLLTGRGWPKSGEGGPSYFDRSAVHRMKLNHAGPVTEADVPNADVILATWWETAEWVWALPSSKGVKAHFMQDYEIWDGQVERVDAVCRLPMPKIVLAKWVANLLSSRFGVEPIALIPNSVETGVFRAVARGKQRVPTVGLAYTPKRHKGVDVVVAAIERARREVPELRVVAFGSSGVTAECPLPKGTEFSYRAPDTLLPGIYAGCDAWLYGARIEGFGLPILEAMACRTPVIATPAGSAPELLEHGGGVVVGMEDLAGMAAEIVRVARMEEGAWRRMSEAAEKTARSYTWEDATDRLEAALEQVRTGMPARGLERNDSGHRKAGVG